MPMYVTVYNEPPGGDEGTRKCIPLPSTAEHEEVEKDACSEPLKKEPDALIVDTTSNRKKSITLAVNPTTTTPTPASQLGSELPYETTQTNRTKRHPALTKEPTFPHVRKAVAIAEKALDDNIQEFKKQADQFWSGKIRLALNDHRDDSDEDGNDSIDGELDKLTHVEEDVRKELSQIEVKGNENLSSTPWRKDNPPQTPSPLNYADSGIKLVWRPILDFQPEPMQMGDDSNSRPSKKSIGQFFSSFYQRNPATAATEQSHGMSLTICSDLLAAHIYERQLAAEDRETQHSSRGK